MNDPARRLQEERLAERERELAILAEASDVVARSLDYEVALRELAQLIVTHLADYCITYSREPDDTIRRVGLVHRIPERQALVESLVRAGPPALTDPYGPGAVIRDGESLLAEDISHGMLTMGAQNGEHLEVLLELAPRSSIVVPMHVRGRTIGAITFAYTAHSGRHYTTRDVGVAEELARRAGLLLDNARLYREARDAIRARDEMLGVITHDLRNPVHAIRSAAAILARKKQSAEKTAHAIHVIDRCAVQMERLIAGLLEVTRADGGGLRLSFECVPAASLVAEACDTFDDVAGERAVRIERDVPDGLPALRGDRGRLLQVLSNLLANAVKFSRDGGKVRVAARNGAAGVRIEVVDDGPGFPKDQLAHVFERFWQREHLDDRGIGLGLAIAKAIVQAHDGAIGADSDEGCGATFWFEIPAQSTTSADG